MCPPNRHDPKYVYWNNQSCQYGECDSQCITNIIKHVNALQVKFEVSFKQLYIKFSYKKIVLGKNACEIVTVAANIWNIYYN